MKTETKKNFISAGHITSVVIQLLYPVFLIVGNIFSFDFHLNGVVISILTIILMSSFLIKKSDDESKFKQTIISVLPAIIVINGLLLCFEQNQQTQMFIISQILAYPLTYIYLGYNDYLMNLSLRAFRIFSISFIVFGINIFGSGFFTALNNGVISALISFLRTLVLQVIAISILPIFFKEDGIWFSVVVAELMAFILTIIFLKIKRKRTKTPTEKWKDISRQFTKRL